MRPGKVYKIVSVKETNCETCHQKIEGGEQTRRFPFDEEYGLYLGELPNGFLSFRFSGQKEGMLAGGSFEEVKADVSFSTPQPKSKEE